MRILFIEWFSLWISISFRIFVLTILSLFSGLVLPVLSWLSWLELSWLSGLSWFVFSVLSHVKLSRLSWLIISLFKVLFLPVTTSTLSRIIRSLTSFPFIIARLSTHLPYLRISIFLDICLLLVRLIIPFFVPVILLLEVALTIIGLLSWTIKRPLFIFLIWLIFTFIVWVIRFLLEFIILAIRFFVAALLADFLISFLPIKGLESWFVLSWRVVSAEFHFWLELWLFLERKLLSTLSKRLLSIFLSLFDLRMRISSWFLFRFSNLLNCLQHRLYFCLISSCSISPFQFLFSLSFLSNFDSFNPALIILINLNPFLR